MSLAKWAAKNLKGKGAKLGETLGEGYASAKGGIEGLLSAVGEAGPDLLKGAGNIAKGAVATHPGKSLAAAGGTGALLTALGMSDDDEDDTAPLKKQMYRPKKKSRSYC